MKGLKHIWRFLTMDIFLITEKEVSRGKYTMIAILKTIVLSIRHFSEDRIMNMASALTYSTFLSIVPALAMVFAIAKGFGVDSMVVEHLTSYFDGQPEIIQLLTGFVESYIANAKSGLFVGIGLLLLLWTVINLVLNIDYSFNKIWETKGGMVNRKIFDYMSLFLIVPVFLIVSSGFSVYLTTVLREMESYVLLSDVLKLLIKCIPYVIVWAVFTGLYMYVPNTKVQFKYAMISGVLTGTVFQLLQTLYIHSQMLVSNYNAVYGSFAAIPLLLIWLQLSWTLCLLGVEITYLGQNVQNFDYEMRSKADETRLKTDFLCVWFMTLIVRNHMDMGSRPFTCTDLSRMTKTHVRLSQRILNKLEAMQLVSRTISSAKKGQESIAYIPSKDVSDLSIGTVLGRLEAGGAVGGGDVPEMSGKAWSAFVAARKRYYESCDNILLKDISL